MRGGNWLQLFDAHPPSPFSVLHKFTASLWKQTTWLQGSGRDRTGFRKHGDTVICYPAASKEAGAVPLSLPIPCLSYFIALLPPDGQHRFPCSFVSLWVLTGRHLVYLTHFCIPGALEGVAHLADACWWWLTEWVMTIFFRCFTFLPCSILQTAIVHSFHLGLLTG